MKSIAFKAPGAPPMANHNLFVLASSVLATALEMFQWSIKHNDYRQADLRLQEWKNAYNALRETVEEERRERRKVPESIVELLHQQETCLKSADAEVAGRNLGRPTSRNRASTGTGRRKSA